MMIMDHDSARSRVGRSALGDLPAKEDGRSDEHFEGFIVRRKTDMKRTSISNCLHFGQCSFYINKLCDSPI